MSTENTETNKELETNSPENEVIPSMDDFKDQIDNSFKRIVEGDLLKGTVIGISDTELSLDLGTYTEGIIRLEELSNDPSFSIHEDVTIGEELSAVVINRDDGHGNILLSKRQADNLLAWDKLTEDLESKKKVKVKIAQAVNAGVIAYLYGVRAFIPASQLSLEYVEDLESWVGKEIETLVITASKDDNKLILSGKEVEIEKAEKDRQSKISKLTRGTVTSGTVEKIMPYGAFVNIGNGLSGLLHISQISEKRIKSPNEVIKEGETVNVKITDVKEGKISLSMKAVQDKEEVVEDFIDVPTTYSSGDEATTSLGSLLKDFKL
ncbi:MAG: S1 RNA-binding domain-containing protein [Clostridiales bacterium]|nr:S1 RNA-binding domain-containing protein [Clostridiales bacterium]